MDNNLSDFHTDTLDDQILALPCYEPSGLSINVSVRDLLRHMLLIGQTGSGKTTILNRILSDLIGFRDSQGRGMGLLIMDSQFDGTAARIRQMAAEAGRAEDVCVLSPEEGYINPLGELRSFNELGLAVSVLTSASQTARVRGDNPYWAENTQLLIECALAVLMITEENISIYRVIEFASELFLKTKWSKKVEETLEAFEKSSSAKVSPGVGAKLTLIGSTIKSWKTFDGNTKGILRTCLEVALAPFLSAPTLPYWDTGKKGTEIHPAHALKGKIVVVSVSGSSEPETAGLITKLAKIEFYRAAQSRTALGNNYLAALVMDELPLAVTSGSSRWSDVSNLATLRGKGVAVIGATQGLCNLDLVVDSKVTQAMVVNFSNLILLRSQEFGNLSDLAAKIFGTKSTQPKGTRISTDKGDLLVINQPFQGKELICPEGALSRLEPHQAYIALSNGYRTASPVWLSPLYFDQAVEEPLRDKRVDPDLTLLKRKLKPIVASSLPHHSTSLFHILINRPRRSCTKIDLHSFARELADLGHDNLPRADLETLPKCWRKAIIRLADRLGPEVTVCELRCEKGLLVVQIDSPSATESQKKAARWRRSVYPSQLGRLSRTDRRWLRKHYPHLLPSDE